MSKALDMAKISAKGSFHLFWGMALSTIISALGVIVIARLLSPAEYGIVGIAMIVPNLIVLFCDLGVNSALVKYVAQFRAQNKHDQIKHLLKVGFLFKLLVAGLFTIATILLSDFIAVHVFLRPDITFLIQVAALTIFAGSLTTSAKFIFIGHEKMQFHSIAIILQAIVKVVLAPALVLLGYGALGAIAGTAFAFAASGIASVIFFYLTIYKKTIPPKTSLPRTFLTLKTMIKYGLPLSMSVLIVNFLNQFFRSYAARYVSDAAMGNFNVAFNFSVLITFFATPITLMMFPAFSKLNPKTENQTLQSVFQYSVKYAALLVVPAAAIMISLAEPAISTVFGQQYAQAPYFLALYSVFYLYSAFGYLSITRLLDGLGETFLHLKITLASLVVALPASLVLIPFYGIVGLIVATLIVPVPITLFGLLYVKKTYGLFVNWTSSVKIVFASVLAGVVSFLVVSVLIFPSWIQLAVGALVFMIIYLTLTPLSGAVRELDLINLKQTLSSLGPIAKLLNPILTFMEKLAPKTNTTKKHNQPKT